MTESSPPTDSAALEPLAAGSVVVGHDGSAAAHHALMTALSLAEQLGAPVVIVRAWSVTTAPRPPDCTFGSVPSWDELQQAVHDAMVSEMHHVVDQFPDVQITFRAVHDNPAQSLIALSTQARMLVVGSRGLGGFAEFVFGSVSDVVVRNASCPVLVTKKPES